MRSIRTCALALTLLLVGVEVAQAGFFQNLIQLERRKNQWLRETFFGRR